MTPEKEARVLIDQHLRDAGWIVQDSDAINLSEGMGIAVREFPLNTGFADYLLYADGKAIGVVEAKPEGFPLKGVETQSSKYTFGLPKDLPHYHLPLPFAYETTGKATQFTNALEPDFRSREVFSFHRPEELIRLVTKDDQMRSLLRKMPALDVGQLWRVQIGSITNLEKSLAKNDPRALIQMATGSGKTFTAVNFCYRLIKYAQAKRILFLVDRNNLGKQTLKEFQQFSSPTTGYKFTEEYEVQRLTGKTISPSSKVCITTIQRLYAMLANKELDEDAEEGSLFETDTSLVKEPMMVGYNPAIPIETLVLRGFPWLELASLRDATIR
jgi:type I restriction enzyme R subunit